MIIPTTLRLSPPCGMIQRLNPFNSFHMTGALLVLLFGMANSLLGPAILMVVAISAGMALAMSGIGVLAIVGRGFVDRKLKGDQARQHRFANGARIAGAAVVLLIGIGLFSLTLTLDRLPASVTLETKSDAP